MADQTFLQTMSMAAQCFPTQHSSPDKDPGKLKEACSELESLFVYYLLKEMRATVPKSGLMGEGKTEETYTSMLDLQLSKEIAKNRGIGIASAIFEKLYNHVESSEKDISKTVEDQ